MEFITEELLNYCLLHSAAEMPVLKELARETHLKVMQPRMLSGHLQGQFLQLISTLCRPKHILEIGTYTGYSAICLAQGLIHDGKIITIDINEELEAMCRRYFEKSGLSNKIDFRIGSALDIIPSLNETFDLVFIDADKKNYSNYFDLIIDKVNPGGIILADNVLWSGKILMPEEKMDADTVAIHHFNKKVNSDNRVACSLLPIRDGIMMMRKI